MVRRHRGRRGGDRGRPRRHLGRHQRGRRPGRGRHQREHRPRGVPRPDHAGDRGGEGRHRRSRGRPSCSARPTPSWCRSSPSATPSASSPATSTSASARTALALGGRLVDLFTPYASYPDVFVPLHGAHQADNAAAALDRGRVLPRACRSARRRADAFAPVSSPGRLEVVGHNPLVVSTARRTSPARARCARALDEEFPARQRTLGHRCAARRRTRTRCSRRSVSGEPTGSSAAVPRSRARRSGRGRRRRRATLGVDPRERRGDRSRRRRGDGTRSTRATPRRPGGRRRFALRRRSGRAQCSA